MNSTADTLSLAVMERSGHRQNKPEAEEACLCILYFFNSYLWVPEVCDILLRSFAGPVHRNASSLSASICTYVHTGILFHSLSLIPQWFYSPTITIQLQV